MLLFPRGSLFLLATVIVAAASPVATAQGPDVIVGDLPSTTHWGSVGSKHSYSVATTSCNIGNVNLNWFANTNQHPVIGQNMYRLASGRFEQIGMSWLKHGFFALSQNLCDTCNPTDGTTLGVGCSDPYTSSLNGNQGGLGPRFEVNATRGSFPYPWSNPAGSTGNAIFKRIQVEQSDLTTPGALYFVEGHYVTPDDASSGNGLNNASYRRCTVNGSFSLSLQGITAREEPAIMAWPAFDTGVVLQNVDYLDGGLTARFIVGYKTSDNGDGTWHYEYAIQNLNSHRSGGGLIIPLGSAAAATTIGFHDVDYHSGEPYDNTDWIVTVTPSTSVRWDSPETFAKNPDSNALRWGTLYTFWFDSAGAPVDGDVQLDLFRTGSPSSLTFTGKVPGDVGPAPVRIQVVGGLPPVLAPGESPVLLVSITEGDDTLIPGSPTLHYRFDGGVYQTIPLASVGGDLYEATLPGPSCGDIPEVYFSAEGPDSGVVTNPTGAPAQVYDAMVGVDVVTFEDNFETDKGWTAENLGASSGDWQRGVPVNDPGWDFDPQSDSDGSGQCFLTQNQFGNTDVDGGAVRLTSPAFDLAAGNAAIQYDYFLRLTNTSGGVDALLVEINNGDAVWIEIARHTFDGGLSWRTNVVTQADLDAAGVTVTSTMRLRFTANDGDPQSINESGVDAVLVGGFVCDDGVVCIRGDVNDDGGVNGKDVKRFIEIVVGDAPTPVEVCAGDLEPAPNGAVDLGDLDNFVQCLLSGGCP